MDISSTKKGNNKVIIKVLLSPADYQEAFDKNLKAFAENATVKGFRQNSKERFIIIQKRYGKKALQHAVFTLAERNLLQYVDKHKIPVIDDAICEEEALNKINWKPGESFSFAFSLRILSDFTISIDPKTVLEGYKVDAITDKAVEDYISAMRMLYGKEVDLPSVTEMHEGIYYMLVREKDKKLLCKITLTKALLTVIDLKGRKIKDEINVSPDIIMKFQENFEADLVKKAQKANGSLSFVVERIVHLTLAKVDQAFFDNVLGPNVAKDVHTFKQHIRKRLLKNKQVKAEDILHKKIKTLLLDILRAQLSEEYKEDKQPLYWNLIVNKIADENHIKVTDEEFQRYFLATCKLFAIHRGWGASETVVNRVTDFFSKRPGYYDSLRKNVLAFRVLEFIKKKITISEKTITTAELEKHK